MAVYTHTTESESIFQIQTPSFAIESGSFAYNQDSSLYIVVLDCGDILDGIGEEVDSGNILDNIGYIEDYGSILTDTDPAFGELDTLDANTIIGFTLGHIGGGVAFALQGGSVSSFGNAYIGYEGNIFDIGGGRPPAFNYVHEGSGNLSGIIGAAERVTSSFNVSSVALFLREDYNLISESEDEEEDYGYISTDILNSFEDYNTITIRAQNNPYGLFRVAGDASPFIRFSLTTNDPITQAIQYHGTGNEAIAPFIPPGSGKFGISGGLSKESFTPSTEIGTGTISNFVTKEERATFSYNQSSQNFLTDKDFGFISESSPTISSYANTQISTLANEVVSTFTVAGNIEADDFGIISELVNRPDSEDFGRITDKDDKPFGFFRFEGDASKTVSFILTANPEGGSLFGFGGGAEAVAPFIPVEYGLFNFFGAATEKISPAPHVGSGSLFNFISKEERRTFSYNGSSTVDQDDIDFGFISEAHVDQDDFGIISEFVNRPDSEDFGFISTVQNRPYGSLRFEGDNAKTARFRLRYPGSGRLFAATGAAETFGTKEEAKVLFRFAGDSTQSASLGHVGSGSLFNIITTDKSRTFSYNGSSVTGDRIVDYRLINEAAVEFEDYGTVTDFPDSGIYDTISYHQEDYGLISVPVGDTRRPFGRFRFAGNADEAITPASHIGTGSLFTFIGSSESTTQDIPPGQVLFNFAGSATERITPAPEVGSGSLFNFISKEERRTFSYNGSSIVTREDIDFGSISEAHVDQDDFGIISELVNRPDSEDFGFISTILGRPYGSLRFTGDASRSAKFRIRASGGGSLFALGGGNESITPFIPARFGLFTVAGAVTQSFTPAPEIGAGTLFNFVTKEERRTFSYNGSSVVTQEDIDYGFISEIAVTPSPSISTYASTPISNLANEVVSTFGVVGDYDDYGSIGELVNAPGSADYGFLDSVDKRPFGRFRFSGKLSEKFIPKYPGSGSLFALGGVATVVTQSYVAKVLFGVGGSATISLGPAPHIGSGVLFTFVSADESKTFRHISDESTGLRISGEVSDLASTADEVGTGRLFAATGAAESFGANPFIPPALFKFKSGSTESFTPATHIVTGVVSPRRASAIFDPEEKIRLVGATESTTNSPDIPASGFSIKAPPVRIFFQYREQGGGKLTLAGNARIRLNPRHRGSGELYINGIGNEATVPFIPPGSGSLFSFVNGDESTTPATHIGQGNLFRPRGEAFTQFPRGFTGNGLIRLNVESDILVVWDYPVNLTIPVRGESDNAIAYGYNGSGKFTISDESDNYFANRFFSFSGGFSILGKAGVRVPRVYSGSGTLFAFDSSAENTGANPPDRTLPIRLIGTANESKTEIFNGSGFITSAEKRAQRVLRYTGLSSPKISQYANTPISDLSDEVISEFLQQGLLEEYTLASANESFVSAPPTKDNAITVEGSRENENATSDYVGSGSLFTFDSSAESTLYSPIGEITLFEFEGNLEESRAFSYSEKTQGLFGKDTNLPKPFGKQFVFGTASIVSVSSETGKDKAFRFDGGITSETFAPANKAEGGLFGFNSSTESVLYSPIGEITLFEFEGNSDESITAVSIGSGSLFGFVSGAESTLVEPPIETLLLNITGSATERITPAPHSGSGTVFAFVGSAESKTSAEDKKVLFRFNIEGIERSVSAFEGTGTITSFVGSANAFTFDYPLTQKILKIFGTKLESFARANYNGESTTEFVGASSDKVVEYEAPKPIRLYII